MPLPSWVTAQNTRFDGTTQLAVDCGEIDEKRVLVIWDTLPIADQILFEQIIGEYGNQVPLPSPVAGFQVIEFLTEITDSIPTGLERNKSYKLKICVNDVDHELSFLGSQALTYGNLVDIINTVGALTATIEGTTIKLSSNTTGDNSDIMIKENNFVKSLAYMKRVRDPMPGVDTILDIFSKVKGPNGEFLHHLINTQVIGTKPAAPVNVPKTTSYTYYGGTPASWRYTADDTLISNTENDGSGPTDIEIDGTNINFLG